jgi:hypothetical protein
MSGERISPSDEACVLSALKDEAIFVDRDDEGNIVLEIADAFGGIIPVDRYEALKIDRKRVPSDAMIEAAAKALYLQFKNRTAFMDDRTSDAYWNECADSVKDVCRSQVRLVIQVLALNAEVTR